MNAPVARAPAKLPKRLLPGQRVSGSVGKFIDNPRQLKRKVRERLFGNVLEEVGNKMFKVQFDDGEIRSVKSHILRIEKASALLPLEEIPPAQPSNTSAGEIQEDPDDAEEEDERGDPMQDGAPGDEADEASDDEQGGGPSGLYVGENLPPNYHQRLAEARDKIKGMLGQTVVKETFEWTVIAEHHSTDLPQNRFLGIQGLDLHRLEKKTIFAAMLLHLMFQDWKESLHKMNMKISTYNNNSDESSKNNNNKVALFKDHEFITGLALMIGATLYSDQGKLFVF